MNYNYHTHTPRCRHANGTPEEYVIRAIDSGIKYFGFSDHLPFAFPNGKESNYRVPVKEAKEYVSEIAVLKEKYKDKIDIKIGFEMEYYPKYFDEMLKNAIDYGAEYLILGNHFINQTENDGTYVLLPNDKAEDLKEYTRCVVEAIKSGVFSYVAHPDIFNFTGDDSVYCTEARKLCVASCEYDIPLEINFLGMRRKKNYPNELFWKIAGEEKSPVIFGCDAHDTHDIPDKESYDVAMEMVNQYKLNYIGKPVIRKINK